MAKRSINNSKEIGEKIKNRRIALGLTIEDAAKKAGVGTKSWSRYESGEPIREDKYRGVCSTLKWLMIPTDNNSFFDLNEYKKDEHWSRYLEQRFGDEAAVSFIVGSDIFLDEIKEAMEEIATMPKGTHLGQLTNSLLYWDLPEQFLMQYDYDFLYALKLTVLKLRHQSTDEEGFKIDSVLDQLALYLCVKESEFLAEESEVDIDEWEEWVFDIFGDMDIVTMLYSELFVLDATNIYHFDNWMNNVFA